MDYNTVETVMVHVKDSEIVLKYCIKSPTLICYHLSSKFHTVFKTVGKSLILKAIKNA